MEIQMLNEVLDVHTAKSYEYTVTPPDQVAKWATPIEFEATFKSETGKEYAIRFYKDKQYGAYTRCVAIMLRKETTKWSQKAYLDPGTAKKAIVTMMKAYHEFKTSTYGKSHTNAFALFLQPDIAKYASVITTALERSFKTDPVAKLKLYAATDEGLKANATGLFYINPTNKTQPYFQGKSFDPAWETTALALSLKPASEQVPASDVQHDKKALATQASAEAPAKTTSATESNFMKLYKSTAKKPLYIMLDQAESPFGKGTLLYCYTAQKTALGDKCLIKITEHQKVNTVPSSETTSLWIYDTTKFTILTEEAYKAMSAQYSAAYNNKPAVNSIYHVGDVFYSENMGANIKIQSIVYLASEKDAQQLPDYASKAQYTMSLMNHIVYVYRNMNTQSVSYTSEETFTSLIKSGKLVTKGTKAVEKKPTEALYKKGTVFTTQDGLMKVIDSVYISDYDTYIGFLHKHQKLVDDTYNNMKDRRFYILQAFATDYKSKVSEDGISQLTSSGTWVQVYAGHPLLQLAAVPNGDTVYIKVLETFYLSGDYELSQGDVIRCEKSKIINNSVFVNVESVNSDNKIIDLGDAALSFGYYDKFIMVTSKEYQLDLYKMKADPNEEPAAQDKFEEFKKLRNYKEGSTVYVQTFEERILSNKDKISENSRMKCVVYINMLHSMVLYVHDVRDSNNELKSYSDHCNLTFYADQKFKVITEEAYAAGLNTAQNASTAKNAVPTKKYSMGQLVQSANGSVFKIIDGAYMDGPSMFETMQDMYPNLFANNGATLEDMKGLVWYVLQDQEDDELILMQENTLDTFLNVNKVWKLLDAIPTSATLLFKALSAKNVGDTVYMRTKQKLQFGTKSIDKDTVFKATVSDKDAKGVDLLIVEIVEYNVKQAANIYMTVNPDTDTLAPITQQDYDPKSDVYIHMWKPSGSSALTQGMTAKVFAKANDASQVPDNLNIPANVIANASYPVLIVVPEGANKAVLVPTAGDGSVFVYTTAPSSAKPEKLKPTFAAPATNDSQPINLYEGTFDAMVASQKVPPEVELFPGVKLKLAAYDFVTLGKTLSTLNDNMGGNGIPKAYLEKVMGELNMAADQYGLALERIIIKSGKYIHPQNTASELKSAINYYTGSGYAGINKVLRKGNGDSDSFKADIANIDEAYRQYGIKFPKDFVVYRGASISNEDLEALQAGKAYEMTSYSSASLNPRVGRNFAKYEAVPALNTMVNGELGSELDGTGISESRQGNKIFMAISGLDQTLSIYIARVSNFQEELELLINRGTFVKKNGELVHIHTSKSNKTRAWYGRFRVVHTTNEGRLVDVLSLLEQANPEIGEIVDTMDKVGLLQYFIQLKLDDLAEEQELIGL